MGAVASLCALDVTSSVLAASQTSPILYTFGAPRLGNAAFRSISNVLVPDTFRIVAARDFVPTLPPSISYRQHGREVWLDEFGEPTFVMSWAMRHILPARDMGSDHKMTIYYGLLSEAFKRAKGQPFVSAFQYDPLI